METEQSETAKIPNALRWSWLFVGVFVVGWYFLGYVRSLDSYLGPVYQRWPALQTWIGGPGS